ncbi:MAG: 30S ribosomal protein S17 [Candidatus Omnitrophica bacterium]|nr:30S ribosomal protein S17 [Candidatus Omnitrophota bacterium]
MAVPSTTTPARAERKVRLGRVTSNKMQKTIVVQVVRSVRHPQYSRVIDQVSSFKAHDEANRAKIGDWVKIMETRPLSKDKRWRLVEIIKAASTAPAVPDAEQGAKTVKTVKRVVAE